MTEYITVKLTKDQAQTVIDGLSWLYYKNSECKTEKETKHNAFIFRLERLIKAELVK